jgi:hypothetical protein
MSRNDSFLEQDKDFDIGTVPAIPGLLPTLMIRYNFCIEIVLDNKL